MALSRDSSALIHRDLKVIKKLCEYCKVWVSITVETDMDPIPGFPKHAFPPLKRLDTLKAFKIEGISTQATISPLMPLADSIKFSHSLDEACDRVILDHYLIGDGSNGLRTKRTDFVDMLVSNGYSEWTKIEKLWEIRDLFQSVLGKSRILISRDGFNAV